MNELYESRISVKRWIVYDIFGNLGWIGYFICAGMLLRGGSASGSVLFPAALMLIGIVELISERIARLDYVLPRKRLYRGFGALTLGGVCGAVYGLGFIWFHGQAGVGLLCSGVLCAVFAGLLFREYHPMNKGEK